MSSKKGARSKTPTKSTPSKVASKAASKSTSSGSSGFDFNSNEVQLALTVAAFSGAVFRSQGGVGLSAFQGFLADTSTKNFDWKVCSCNFLLTCHVVNILNFAASKSGYWLQNLVASVFAAFAGNIVLGVFAGESIQAACFNIPGGLECFAFTWYLIRQDFFGLWGTVKGFGGDALNNILSFSSTLYTTNLIIGAASQGSLAQGIVMGVIAGTASEFWPLDNGISFRRSEDANNAFNVAAFISGNGFALFDTLASTVIGLVPILSDKIPACTIGATVNGIITNYLNCTTAQFVLLVTFINLILGVAGSLNPLKSLPVSTGPGFDIFGVSAKVQELLQLN